MADQNNKTNGGHDHPKEIIIKINLEDVYNNRQCHPDKPDPGTVIYYIIKIDKQEFEVKEHALTGTQLLAKVGLTPDKYRIFELGDGQREIMPDELADFRKRGIERFKTVAKHANEGFEVANKATQTSIQRRMVRLNPDDENYLNKIGANWETLLEGNTGWIIIHSFDIPSGYSASEVSVAFMIPPSYPTVEFDMMYFFPALSRTDTKPIGALSSQTLDGKSYQRWSRHRMAGEWRSGQDNLETHVLSVKAWLIDELKKR